MNDSYSPFLELISVFIGIFSIYTAFILAERIIDKRRSSKTGWIYTVSFIFGLGFYSMHLIEELGENNHFAYTYDLVQLFVSLVIAVLSSFFAFSILSVTTVTKRKIIQSTLMLGLGLNAFHYTATAAIKQAVIIHFTSFFFFLSLVLSILFAFIFINLLIQLKQNSKVHRYKYVISSILLGLTKYIMHFTGSKAVTIIPDNSPVLNGIELFELVLIIALLTLLIMVFALCLAFFDYRQLLSERRLMDQMKESEERYRRLVENSPESIIVHDGEEILFVNERCVQMAHASNKNELLGKKIMDFIVPEYREMIKKRLELLFEGRDVKPVELQLRTLSGTPIDVEINGVRIFYNQKPTIQLILRDLTERKKMIKELEASRQRLQSLFIHNPDGVYSLDCKGFITEVNPFLESMLGYSKEELVHMTFQPIIDSKDLDRAKEMFIKTVKGQSQSDEIIIIRKNGEKIPVYITEFPIIVENEIIGVYGIAKDISKLKDAQIKMTELAFTDQLTRLPNRTWFYKEFENLMERAKKNEYSSALFQVDIDNFKIINDTLGHHTGDLFLRKVADRVKNSFRKNDLIARMGGDEFIIVQENLPEEEVRRMAELILKEMTKPILVNGHEIVTSISIGISLFNNYTDDFETLLKQADFAMYSAKEKGKNNYQFFTDDLNEKVIRRHQLEKALREAIHNNEFRLYYQPQIDIQTGHLVGVEALLRWNPSFGFVSPAEFIPIAEETGLIVPIGEWVIREACRQVTRWKKQGFQQVRVSVNVSARQFSENDFAKKILRILKEENMDPRDLEIEITETVMLNVKDSLIIIEELKKSGILFAIDDFGTGYSSLNVISAIEFDTLKIDKSLIDDIHNTRKVSILNTILNAPRFGNMQIVIEGIETEEQVQYLQSFQVIGQGYYFGRPSPPEMLDKLWKC